MEWVGIVVVACLVTLIVLMTLLGIALAVRLLKELLDE